MANKPKRIGDEEIQSSTQSIHEAMQIVARSHIGTGEVIIAIDRGHVVDIDWRLKGRTWHSGKPVQQPAAD